MKVIISAGSYKFHLSPLAAEMAKNGRLAAFITAGWPKNWQKALAEFFPNSAGWLRFLDRHEPIPDILVLSIPAVEFILKIADIFIRKRSQRWQQRIQNIGFWLYITRATRQVNLIVPDIYHYRNCYGGNSVRRAQNLGSVSLCDHSIAHPLCLDWMEKNNGEWPNLNMFEDIRSKILPLYKRMEEDLHLANHIVVNSDFVKNTCVYAGLDSKKIHVAYLGVDDSFFHALPSELKKSEEIPANSLLYAGGWQRRKGVQTLVEALNSMDRDWSLDIAGGVEPETAELPAMEKFFSNTNVNRYGTLPRDKLAALMKRHRIFIFPSYCEGSARVIFEAMAAGCFVITTPNSGSIVKDRVHGLLIKPGDSVALKEAIKEALSSPDWVGEVGLRNAKLIDIQYRQSDYGNRIVEIYEKILAERVVLG